MRRSRFGKVVTLATMLLLGASEHVAQAQYFSFGKNKIQYEARDWQYIQSPHFNVYFYEGGEALGTYTARAAEAAYDEIRTLLEVKLSKRVPILVYQGHGTFAATNAVDLPARAVGIGGATELFKNRVVLPFMGDYRTFRQTLHHELVHAVLNDVLFGGSLQALLGSSFQLDLPLWFSEGLAEYAAVGWNARSDLYLRDAVLHDALPSIDRLHGFLAYKGGQSVWDYVAEQYGREKIAEILGRLRQTHSVEQSFEQATGLALAALSKRWHQALREIYLPAVAAREDLSTMARPLAAHDRRAYQMRPALSPRGDRLAYLTVQGGRFELHLARTSDGKYLATLVEGLTSAAFESLRPQTPGLAWSPDGEHLALVAGSGPSDVVALINVHSRTTTRFRIPGLDQILAVAWSPDGGRLALSAVANDQSDLYVLDLSTRAVTNYTNDAFSDLAPAWSPNGKALVFHSDRGGYLRLGTEAIPPLDAPLQFDLYRLRLGTSQLERLTHTRYADEMNAHFGGASHRLAFRSDRNGIFNLYAKDLRTGAVRPLTDVTSGILQMDFSADGTRAALVSLQNGYPTVYLSNTPFAHFLGPDPLRPTVWAQRSRPAGRFTAGGRQTMMPAPALALASNARRLTNPFLRDAASPDRPAHKLLAAYPVLVPGTAAPLPPERESGQRPAGDSTTSYGGVQITFRNDGEASPPPNGSPVSDRHGGKSPPLEETFQPKKYKLLFSPDLIYGTTGYDALYGVQGLLQMLFSDMMGNHRIFASTNLLLDLRNADYLLSYSYLPHRLDWKFSVYHTARLLPDYDARRYFRYRRYGTSVRASYPLDKFHRFDFDAGVVGVSQVDIGASAATSQARFFFNPAITFTRDVSIPGPLAPRGGHRLAVRLSGGLGAFYFASALADARVYTALSPDGRYTVAARVSGGVSVGSARQLFYAAGVRNWLNRRFDPASGLPITDLSDFAFATPVLPLRGYALNARNGTQFALLNLEMRFPLRINPLTNLLSVLPVRRLRGAAFIDAGTVWGPDEPFTLFRKNAAGARVFDDLLVGLGGGVRALVLGYPLRLDVAWPFNGRRFGTPRVYLSVGFDF